MQIIGIANSYASAPVNAPTSLSASSTTTSQTVISFTAPTNDGGTAITNYEYSFNNSSWTALSPADAASPVTITGLSAGTSYTIYLRAVNIVGSGPGSTGLSVSTPILGEFMVVGGGGGGANGFNNGQVGVTCFGGGGGGTTISSSVTISAGVYTMNVGGAGSTNGGTGGTSSVVFGGSTLYSAAGGNGSYADRYPFGGAGGSGSTSNGTAGSQAGYTVAVGGYSNAFDGTTRTYGSGGGANPGGGGTAGANGEGDGGQSGGGGNPWGGAPGGTGIAMLKILTSNTGRITGTTGTVSTVVTGSYTVYRFTGTGTVTVS